MHRVTNKGLKDDEKAKKALGEFINFCPIISVEGTVMRSYNVDEMMRQIKRISVDAAINSGFDDDTIYLSDAGMKISQFDQDILRKLADVVTPQKKGKKQTDVVISDSGMTDEQHKLADKAKRKPKKDLTEEEKAALELYKKQKEEQKKMFNLLRAVSIAALVLWCGRRHYRNHSPERLRANRRRRILGRIYAKRFTQGSVPRHFEVLRRGRCNRCGTSYQKNGKSRRRIAAYLQSKASCRNNVKIQKSRQGNRPYALARRQYAHGQYIGRIQLL